MSDNIIHISSLDTFQRCPMLWNLSKAGQKSHQGFVDPFHKAIYDTIIRCVSVSISKNLMLSSKWLKRYWDKVWFQTQHELASDTDENLLTQAMIGWTGIDHFISVQIPEIASILNTIFINGTLDNYCLHSRLLSHFDLVSMDHEGHMAIINFGGPISNWNLYNSLSTKAQYIVADSQAPGVSPNKIVHVDITHKDSEKFKINTLYITEEYKTNASKVVEHVVGLIESDSFFSSQSNYCRQCSYKSKCWR